MNPISPIAAVSNTAAAAGGAKTAPSPMKLAFQDAVGGLGECQQCPGGDVFGDDPEERSWRHFSPLHDAEVDRSRGDGVRGVDGDGPRVRGLPRPGGDGAPPHGGAAFEERERGRSDDGREPSERERSTFLHDGPLILGPRALASKGLGRAETREKPAREPFRSGSSEQVGRELRELAALTLREDDVARDLLALELVGRDREPVRRAVDVGVVDLARVPGEDDLRAVA